MIEWIETLPLRAFIYGAAFGQLTFLTAVVRWVVDGMVKRRKEFGTQESRGRSLWRTLTEREQ